MKLIDLRPLLADNIIEITCGDEDNRVVFKPNTITSLLDNIMEKDTLAELNACDVEAIYSLSTGFAIELIDSYANKYKLAEVKNNASI